MTVKFGRNIVARSSGVSGKRNVVVVPYFTNPDFRTGWDYSQSIVREGRPYSTRCSGVVSRVSGVIRSPFEGPVCERASWIFFQEVAGSGGSNVCFVVAPIW